MAPERATRQSDKCLDMRHPPSHILILLAHRREVVQHLPSRFSAFEPSQKPYRQILRRQTTPRCRDIPIGIKRLIDDIYPSRLHPRFADGVGTSGGVAEQAELCQ